MPKSAEQKRYRKLLAPDERLIFIRGGWTANYDSRRDKDRPQGGGSHNDEHIGCEWNNFHPYRGRYYVYTRARWNQPLTLQRLGADPGASKIGAVTVVQVATRPEGGQVVVGWFRGAIAYSDWKYRPFAPTEVCCFIAPVGQAVLLREDERIIRVPKGVPGAMGQSQVRYASDTSGRLKLDKWMIDILKQIRRSGSTAPLVKPERAKPSDEPANVTGQGRGLTTKQRKAAEHFAMARAIEYYEAQYDSVEDVHAHEPFDLICSSRRGRRELRVEVKGTTGNASTLLVTRGEIASARAHETALFIASELTWADKTAAVLNQRGWRQAVVAPWVPDPNELVPTVYEWNNPAWKGARR